MITKCVEMITKCVENIAKFVTQKMIQAITPLRGLQKIFSGNSSTAME